MDNMTLEQLILGEKAELTIEEQLIGNMIAFVDDNVAECLRILKADDFTSGRCAALYNSVVRLSKQGTRIDIGTVYTDLVEHNVRDVSAVELARLTSCERTDPYRLAVHIAEQSRRRTLMVSLSQAIKDVGAADKPLSGIVEGIRKVIDEAIATEKQHYVCLREPMKELMEAIIKRSNGDVAEGIMTGFTIIDEKGGLQPSDLNIVAGDTSMGKTSLAMCIIKNIAQAGTPCAVYSMEMSCEQLCARLLAVDMDDNKQVGQVLPSSSDILYNNLNVEQYTVVHNAYTRIGNLPIYIDMRASHDIDEICASIRALVYVHKVKVVVLDYIQLVDVKRQSDDVKAMDKIARDLKVLAKELGIVVIALSQLSRVKEGSSPVPTMRRLRNSGGIEQAADNIYLIFRAEYYKTQYPGGWSTYPTHNTALLIRAKGRNIGMAERLLEFSPAATAYRNYDAARYQAHNGRENKSKLAQPSSEATASNWSQGLVDDTPF